jgi:hypothetical protein
MTTIYTYTKISLKKCLSVFPEFSNFLKYFSNFSFRENRIRDITNIKIKNDSNEVQSFSIYAVVLYVFFLKNTFSFLFFKITLFIFYFI